MEDLGNNLQQQLSLGIKSILTFLGFSLIIVQDILHCVVREHLDHQHNRFAFASLMRLRGVNKFFEAEITHHTSRYFPCWANKYGPIICRAPRDFVVRVLEAYIGEHDREGCEFTAQMHEVFDLLMAQCALISISAQRHEILHTLCDTIAMTQCGISIESRCIWRHPRSRRSGEITQIHQWDPIPTAFVVAVGAGWDDTIANMLATHPRIACDLKWKKGCPLANAKSYDLGTELDLSSI
jgi:hypothetical protein